MSAMDSIKELLNRARQQGRTKQQIENIVEQATEKATIKAQIKIKADTQESKTAINQVKTVIKITLYEQTIIKNCMKEQAKQITIATNNYRRMHSQPIVRQQSMRRVDRNGKASRTDNH